MKIKTITCHEVYNHGASLQEYALLKYLDDLGHEVETINYKPDYLSNHFNFWNISNPKYDKPIINMLYLLIKFPKRFIALKRKRHFDRFSDNYIKSTPKLYRTNEDLKKDLPIADAYICGSDQIWNSFFQNGKDPAFYLDFVPDNSLKISYAASFAIDKLEENIKPFVHDQVKRLNHISVRESSGKKILEDLGFTNVNQVLDPVFLLEKEDWLSLQHDSVEKNDYVFVYDFDSNPKIQEFAQNLKKQNNWDIITVNEQIKYADKNYFLEGPDKFLTLVKNAKFVISNSFHAVAFSIIFQKNFVVFNRHDKINTRMRDMLRSIGAEHLLILNDHLTVNHQLNIINYTEIQQTLNVLIKQSKAFLFEALNDYA